MNVTPYTVDFYKNGVAGSRRSAEIVVPLTLGFVHPRRGKGRFSQSRSSQNQSGSNDWLRKLWARLSPLIGRS